jgi:two-component system, NtrC family, sensor kinase
MPMNAAARSAFLAAAAVILLGLLAFLYSRTDALDLKRDGEVLSILRELKEYDTRWDAEALRIVSDRSASLAPGDRNSLLARILRELEQAEARPETAGVREGMNAKTAAYANLKDRHAATIDAMRAADESVAVLSAAANTQRLKDPRRAAALATFGAELQQAAGAIRAGDSNAGALAARLATLREAAAAADPALSGPAATAQARLRALADAFAAERAAFDKFSFLTVGSRLDLGTKKLAQAMQSSLDMKERWRVYLFFYAAALLLGVCYLGARVVQAQNALRAANESLEKRVAERTSELSDALTKLKDSEAQLVQTEKMSSLGRMVAGVAHEINTPLAYVKNSVSHARDRVPELRDVVQQAERLVALLQTEGADPKDLQESFAGLTARLGQMKEQQVLSDLEALTKDGLHGIEQISELVANLKNFSRLDRSKVASFNVNEGLNATLLIAKPQLRNVAIARRLGDISSITCSPSQVNQVFLNLVTNAAQALDKPEKTITITTRPEGNDAIAVEVADNGKGIAQDVLPKIFDPFFTTKEIGKGTGLGLSIAYKIVAQHGGHIDVKSQLGNGTTFTVVLPIRPPAELARET